MSMQTELQIMREDLTYSKPTISAIVLSAKDEEFLDLTLKSLIGMVDQVILLGNMSNELQDKIEKIKPNLDYKLDIIYRTWDGNYGAARNEALTHVASEWVLSIDADEVLSDEGYLLRDYAQKGEDGKIYVYDFKMEHFIRDLGHVDNTVPEHFAINRFYKKFEDTQYSDGLHEIVSSKNYVLKGRFYDCVLYHLGYVKSIITVVDKYLMNIKNSKIHTKEFLDWWKTSHVTGKYPVKEFPSSEIRSMVLHEAFIL